MLALLGLVAQFEDLFLIPQFTMKRVLVHSHALFRMEYV
jgi:hypothetical protein